MKIEFVLENTSSLSLTLSALTKEEAQTMMMRLMAQVVREEARAAKRNTPAFEVKFIHYGDRKIEVIKEIRAHLGVGLKEAKDASEAGPHVILKTGDRSKAAAFCNALRACGATVEFGVAA